MSCNIIYKGGEYNLNVSKESGVYYFSDKSQNIDCYYDTDKHKFVGNGSRKHNDVLLSALENKILSEVSDDLNNDNPTKEQLEMSEIKISDYSSTISSIWNGLNMVSVFEDVDKKTLHKYQNNPSKYNPELRKLSLYWYGQKGILNKSYELLRNLHSLRSSLKTFNIKEENIKELLYDIKILDDKLLKKDILRDIIFQTVAEGTCLGYIRGNTLDKKYIQILNLDYYIAKYRVNGVWQIEVDLYKFSNISRKSRDIPNDHMLSYDELKPNAVLDSQPVEVRRAYQRLVSKTYNLKERGKTKIRESMRYYKLNIDKTFTVKNMAKQNEVVGRPYGLPAFDDLLHKELIRASETALIDRLINIMLVVKMGETGKDGFKPSSKARTEMAKEVKRAITDNNVTGLKLLGIPYWADIKQLEVDYEIFNKDKYSAIDDDIAISLGVQGMFGGSKQQTFAGADLSLKMLFTSIFNLLEQVESNLLNHQYDVLVKKHEKSAIIRRKFTRTTDLNDNELADAYKYIMDMGGSIKRYLDAIGDIDFDEYIEQTRIEQEDLELRNILIPYLKSYTTTEEDLIKDKEPADNNQKDDGNSQSKPSTS